MTITNNSGLNPAIYTHPEYITRASNRTFSLLVMELDSEPDDSRRLRVPINYKHTHNRKHQIIITLVMPRHALTAICLSHGYCLVCLFHMVNVPQMLQQMLGSEEGKTPHC